MPITIEVITPEKVAIRGEVDEIIAPASDGSLGILPHHAPLLTILGVGELRMRRGSETSILAVTGGFLEVRPGSQVAIFAETAEMEQEIDVERARLAAERAKTKLASPQDLDPAELAQLEAALGRAIARIKIGERVRRTPRPTIPGTN
jgi:F-type H+-transporting ATPase subunit epsilon